MNCYKLRHVRNCIHQFSDSNRPNQPGAAQRSGSLVVAPSYDGGSLGLRVMILVSDASIKLMTLGAKLDPSHVLLRVGRGTAEVRRRHVPIPEVERVGSGDDEEANFGMEGDGRNHARRLHAPRLAPSLGGREGRSQF